MSGVAFLRVEKLKGGGIIGAAARHNRRVIQAEKGASDPVDPTRSHLNETLRGPPTADGVAQLAKDLMRVAGLDKLRKDAVTGIEVLFGLHAGTQIDDHAFFTDCAVWAAGYFGGDQNILSVDIHRDEKAPHCHVLILPLVDRRMNGNKLLGGKAKILAMQKDFHEKVAAGYGLRRPPAKLSGAVKDRAARKVEVRLRETGDSALHSKVWAAVLDAIAGAPEPFLIALGMDPRAKEKPSKTMVQIFTGKGKGGTKESKAIAFAPVKKTIAFASQNEDRRLCSVAFAKKQSLHAPRPKQARVLHEAGDSTPEQDGQGFADEHEPDRPVNAMRALSGRRVGLAAPHVTERERSVYDTTSTALTDWPRDPDRQNFEDEGGQRQPHAEDHGNDTFTTAYGLELADKSAKKMKTMAGKHQSLSCVGIAFPKRGIATTSIARGIATTSIADSPNPKDDGRTVERDFDAPDWTREAGGQGFADEHDQHEPHDWAGPQNSDADTGDPFLNGVGVVAIDTDGVLTRIRERPPDDHNAVEQVETWEE